MLKSEICGNCRYFQPSMGKDLDGRGVDIVEGICTKPNIELPRTFSNLTPLEAHVLNNRTGGANSITREGWTCFVETDEGFLGELSVDLGFTKYVIRTKEPTNPENLQIIAKDIVNCLRDFYRKRFKES